MIFSGIKGTYMRSKKLLNTAFFLQVLKRELAWDRTFLPAGVRVMLLRRKTDLVGMEELPTT